jgi:hypothetical protein
MSYGISIGWPSLDHDVQEIPRAPLLLIPRLSEHDRLEIERWPAMSGGETFSFLVLALCRMS